MGVLVTVQEKKPNTLSFLTLPHLSCCAVFTHHGSSRLSCERNADHMSSVGQYIRLCFQARMSDESDLAPYPGL